MNGCEPHFQLMYAPWRRAAMRGLQHDATVYVVGDCAACIAQLPLNVKRPGGRAELASVVLRYMNCAEVHAVASGCKSVAVTLEGRVEHECMRGVQSAHK